MTLTIELSSELERELSRRAARQGQTLADYARTVLARSAQDGEPPPGEPALGAGREPRVTLAEYLSQLAVADEPEPVEVDAPDRGSLRDRIEARRAFLEANAHRMLDIGHDG
jgi:hypothetical protein